MMRIISAAPRAAALAAFILAAVVLPSFAAAQDSGEWRLGAAAGAFAPRSALIVAADGPDTRLGAGPAFSLDLQYLASNTISVFVAGTAAFATLATGTEISPAADGPSDQVTVLTATGGIVLGLSSMGYLQPTLRLGGGLKGYSFDLEGADNQWRPTGDFGLGFRAGNGPLEVGAEVRYLPSSFDQAKLPIRAIVAQEQRQTDLLLAVGVGVRF